MANENANYNVYQNENTESFDFDELEAELQQSVDELDTLRDKYEIIGTPDDLGQTVTDIVWEQLTNQIAVVAGEDFVKDNRGLRLDLRDDVHIQLIYPNQNR